MRSSRPLHLLRPTLLHFRVARALIVAVRSSTTKGAGWHAEDMVDPGETPLSRLRRFVESAEQSPRTTPPEDLATPLIDYRSMLPREPRTYVPMETHESRTAENTATTSQRVEQLVSAMSDQLELTKATLETAQQAEDRAHRMSVASTWVSAASLLVAAASLVVAIATLATTG